MKSTPEESDKKKDAKMGIKEGSKLDKATDKKPIKIATKKTRKILGKY